MDLRKELATLRKQIEKVCTYRNTLTNDDWREKATIGIMQALKTYDLYECYDDEDIAKFAEGKGDQKERNIFSRHIEQCPFCRDRHNDTFMAIEDGLI